MSRSSFGCALLATVLVLLIPARVFALSGTVNFVVLRVTFSDFGTGTRFTTAQAQANFDNIAKLWGKESSYANIALQYQYAGPYQVASPSATYLDQQGRAIVIDVGDHQADQRCSGELAEYDQLDERLWGRRGLWRHTGGRVLSRNHSARHNLDFSTFRGKLQCPWIDRRRSPGRGFVAHLGPLGARDGSPDAGQPGKSMASEQLQQRF
jgi:hypothetical protein